LFKRVSIDNWQSEIERSKSHRSSMIDGPSMIDHRSRLSMIDGSSIARLPITDYR